MLRAAGACSLLLVLGGPGAARASDAPRPPVPPLFPRAECLSVVDVEDSFFLEVTVPYEDEATRAELADARSARFFALCKSPPSLDSLPEWLTWEDVERASEAGMVHEPPSPDDVLESSTSWPLGTCVVELPGPPSPLTCDGLDGGVVVDASSLGIGNHVIVGYVFAPPVNLWVRRAGVVRVVQGDREPQPVVTLTTPWRRAQTHRMPGFVVEGCAAGGGATQVSLQWARWGEDDWTTFETWSGEGRFARPFVPPDGTDYQALRLRAVVRGDESPESRSLDHAPGELVVLPGCGPSDRGAPTVSHDACGLADQPTPSPIPPDCAEMPEGDGEANGPREPELPEQRDSNAAGCTVEPKRDGWKLWWLLVAGRRRRGRFTLRGWWHSRNGSRPGPRGPGRSGRMFGGTR